MLNRRRWTDLGVEGVVIVASILLAFALDAWWDSRGQRQEETQVEVATVDLARTLIAPTFDPRTGTLDGLLASGRLGILKSESLRQRLAAWPGLLADAAEEEVRSDALIRDLMEPILWKEMDLSPAHTLPVEIAWETCSNVFRPVV